MKSEKFRNVCEMLVPNRSVEGQDAVLVVTALVAWATITIPLAARVFAVADALDVSVLEEPGGSLLTLITCYPFHYVGYAPDRFIVKAVPESTTVESPSAAND